MKCLTDPLAGLLKEVVVLGKCAVDVCRQVRVRDRVKGVGICRHGDIGFGVDSLYGTKMTQHLWNIYPTVFPNFKSPDIISVQ